MRILPLRLLATTLIVLLSLASVSGQTCLGLTFKPGLVYEVQSFTAKDKLNSTMSYTVKAVRREGPATVIEIEFLMKDAKGKPQGNPSVVKYTCTGSELMADLSGMLTANQAAMKDSEMRIKTNRLVYPTQFTGPAKLPDGLLESEFYNNGQLMIETTMAMSNRQVTAQESLTVPAGTYNAWKITADTEIKSRTMGMGLPAFRIQTVSYRTNEVLFDLRTESYRNGKLAGYTVLSKIN